jgi:hypothetical protein
MNAKYPYRLSVIALGLLIVVCASPGRTAPIKSTWICGDGNYSSAKCWSSGVVPINYGKLMFDVDIPANKGPVNVDTTGTVNSLNLGGNTRIKVLAGRSYTITGQADIYGIVQASGKGASFVAYTASFPGTTAQVQAEDGADITMGATSYSSTGLCADSYYSKNSFLWTLFSASGDRTVLRLPPRYGG